MGSIDPSAPPPLLNDAPVYFIHCVFTPATRLASTQIYQPAPLCDEQRSSFRTAHRLSVAARFGLSLFGDDNGTSGRRLSGKKFTKALQRVFQSRPRHETAAQLLVVTHSLFHITLPHTTISGWPIKSKPLPNFQKIVLDHIKTCE